MVLIKVGNGMVEVVDKFNCVLLSKLIVVHLMAAVSYNQDSSVLG